MDLAVLFHKLLEPALFPDNHAVILTEPVFQVTMDRVHLQLGSAGLRKTLRADGLGAVVELAQAGPALRVEAHIIGNEDELDIVLFAEFFRFLDVT